MRWAPAGELAAEVRHRVKRFGGRVTAVDGLDLVASHVPRVMNTRPAAAPVVRCSSSRLMPSIKAITGTT